MTITLIIDLQIKLYETEKNPLTLANIASLLENMVHFEKAFTYSEKLLGKTIKKKRNIHHATSKFKNLKYIYKFISTTLKRTPGLFQTLNE